MRRVLAVILSFALLLQTFYSLGVLAFYYSNQGYVASKLCENRNKPQLHCNGKCFLKKQLKNAESESGKSKRGIDKFELVLLALPVATPSFKKPFFRIEEKAYFLFRPSRYLSQYASSCFHPPHLPASCPGKTFTA